MATAPDRHSRRHVRPDPLRPSAPGARSWRETLRLARGALHSRAARRRIARAPRSAGRAPAGDGAARGARAIRAFSVDEREVRRSGPGYTFDTLTELRAELGRDASARACCSAPTPFSTSRPGTAGTSSSGSRTSRSRTARASRSSAGATRMPQPLAREYAARLMQQPLAVHLAPAGGIVVDTVHGARHLGDRDPRARCARARSPRYLLPDPVLDYIQREASVHRRSMRVEQAGKRRRRGAGGHQGARHRGAGRQED